MGSRHTLSLILGGFREIIFIYVGTPSSKVCNLLMRDPMSRFRIFKIKYLCVRVVLRGVEIVHDWVGDLGMSCQKAFVFEALPFIPLLG